MPPASSFRHQQAFTLIEVMMASLILVVGFIGMIEAMTLTSNIMDNARRQTLAAQIISHEIEKLRLLPWADPSGGPDISTLSIATFPITIDSQFDSARAALGDNETVNSPVIFTMMRTVTNPDPATYLREVNFTVTWVVRTSRLNSDGSLFKLTFTRMNSAYFGKYGLNLTYQRS